MEFRKYQHVERFGTSEVKDIEIGECFIFPKIDGCFPYKANVMLADGTSESIGTIVNQKKDMEVLSYDFKTKKVVPRRITNWFKYDVDTKKIDEEWVTIGVNRNGLQLNSKANSRIKIRSTVNHMIFVKDKATNNIKEVPASNIKTGDIVYTPAEELSVIQNQILLGTLLGDASAYPNSNTQYNGVEFGHSIKQSDYVKHKLKLLGYIGNSYHEVDNPNSFGKKKACGNTLVNKQTQQVYDICYHQNKKTVNRVWLDKLNSLGLATWYMDDGSLHKNISSEIAVFHVEGFSNEEQNIILDFLNDRGYRARIQKSNQYNVIKLDVVGSDKLFTDISQHIIPSMQYKLPDRFKNRYVPIVDDINADICLQEREVISVTKGIDTKPSTFFTSGEYKFDIEVEGTHNYFCDGIMVHNSNSSVWLDNKGELRAGSRKREISLIHDNNGFCAYAFSNKNIKEYLKKYPNHRLFGEFLLPHSLKTYRDDAWRKFYIFDVCIDKDEETLEYIPYDTYKPLLEEFNLDYIPPIMKIKNATYENFMHTLDKNTFLIEDGKGAGEGCFHKRTKITMADGSQKTIGEIKVGDMVKSYNHKTEQIESKRVTNIFYNGLKPLNEWIQVQAYPRGTAGRGHNTKAIICTNNHKFYNGERYEEINNVNTVFHYEKFLDNYRFQFILGQLVSDGCYHKENITIAQKSDNTQTIKEILKDFINKSNKQLSGKGTDITTICLNKKFVHPYFDKYIRNNTIKPIEVFKDLDDIGWASVFMGDGWGGSTCECEFSISSYAKEECEQIQKIFNERFKCSAKLSYDTRVSNGAGGRLRLGIKDGAKFMKRVSRFILPEFRYKIKGVADIADDFVMPKSVEYNVVERDIYKKNPVIDLKTYKNYKNIHAYDIEVEDNHNYFAENCLVHNCVIKNYNYYNQWGRQTWAKIVTNEFKEKHAKEMGSPELNNNTLEEKIVDEFCTAEFIEKEFQKILNDNEGNWFSKMIPQLLRRVWHEFIIEESWNFVSKYKNPTINYKMLNHYLISKVKKVKSDLFN